MCVEARETRPFLTSPLAVADLVRFMHRALRPFHQYILVLSMVLLLETKNVMQSKRWKTFEARTLAATSSVNFVVPVIVMTELFRRTVHRQRRPCMLELTSVSEFLKTKASAA